MPPFIEKSSKDSEHAYISFSVFRLDIFGVLGVCSIERWRANRVSFTFGVSGRCHYLLVGPAKKSFKPGGKL